MEIELKTAAVTPDTPVGTVLAYQEELYVVVERPHGDSAPLDSIRVVRITGAKPLQRWITLPDAGLHFVRRLVAEV